MIALVDCNSFFCSVEKVFHPGLEGRPVCVLSSNDGCIVALTPEAKQLGLKRGDPLFKVRNIITAHQVSIFSGNMQLYAAMSRRIVNILRQSVQRVENYSIDESFCYLDGYAPFHSPEQLMRQVAQKIQLYTDIPVSVGIAASKTLAKMGSKFAKDYKGYHGVCLIDSEEKRRKALAIFPLSQVWGIGRQTLQKLQYYGIRTPLELADHKESWVRHRFNKSMVQTWMELNGIPCIDTSESLLHQSICTSRSFGELIHELPSLKASVATFASSCAGKLREQHACAGAVTVFLQSNPYHEDSPQYANSSTYTFLTPTADTLEITRAALSILEQMYRPDIYYKKSGVILHHILPETEIQGNLFDEITNRSERLNLMKTIDRLNRNFGPRTVQLAVENDGDQQWKSKCDHRSPNYLTNLKEILTIQI